MRELSREELLKAILAVAERHPNTKLSKLIKCVELERSQKNIVLLIIELAEHPEFSSDISISLKYYLDMFDELPEEPQFSEAGLLLLNSAIIYGKRVDNVHLVVERLILSLINTENAAEERHEPIETNSTTATIKKGKKRPLEQSNTPYEADMRIKRFKTISNSKRFDDCYSNSIKKSINSFIESRKKESIVNLSKDFIHPTIWKYSVIEDYEYDDELDSKKNYKLYTYHLEHRYNTLIPDINFQMYFKVKDFINAECQDSTSTELWPPLSDAYIDQYVNLENQILNKEGHDAKNQYINEERTRNNIEETKIRVHGEQPNITNLTDLQIPEDGLSVLDSCGNTHTGNPSIAKEHTDMIVGDSGIGLDSTQDNSLTEFSISIETTEQSSLTSGQIDCHKSVSDSAIECDTFLESQTQENGNESNPVTDVNLLNEALSKMEPDPTLLDPKSDEEDLSTIKVILPHLDDEGVFLSDLDERDQQMLSPSVVATDVFRCVKDKRNIIVIVDDAIKKIYNIQEPKYQLLTLQVTSCPEYPSLPLNILKIHHKYFKKRRIFKLGSEFHLLKKERHKKYSRAVNPPIEPRTWVRLCEDVTGVPLTPNASPNYEPDFYGFPEEIHSDKNRTLSRDSGISLQQIENTSDKELNDEECNDILQNKLQSTALEKVLGSNRISHNTGKISGELIISAVSEPHQVSEANDNSEQTLCNDEVSTQITENKRNQLTTACDVLTINENLTSVMSKVQEWHTHLQPILAQSRDRHHFDIFELGTEIMSQLDRSENNNIISLSHVMENKDSSLISRYFLSTLLLANQGNISININNRDSEDPSALNEIKLKLLTKKRNIVSFEDNIGLIIPKIANERVIQEAKFTNIRTLKPVPTVPHTEDRDSGISMSDGCSF